jgi:hypothetical protein
VHEHLELNITPSQRVVIVFEIEAFSEPKALTPVDLQVLVKRYGGYLQAARVIGEVSEGFIRQNGDFPRKLQRRRK